MDLLAACMGPGAGSRRRGPREHDRDGAARLARVITSAGSRKARHIAGAGPDGALVAVCQVDGRRWVTLEGRAVLRKAPESVAEAERRYAERYRIPRPNPERVVIEISVRRIIGSL